MVQEARERAIALDFPPPAVSAGIDLLLNFARRREVARAEELLDEVTEGVEAASGFHGWLWTLRLAEARAEIALARGAWEEAFRWATEAISQSQARQRVKYQAVGLRTRAQALAAQGRTKQAISDLRPAVELARALGDPALFLHTASALLALGGDEALASEARTTRAQIVTALPEGGLRTAFEEAEALRLMRL